MLGDWHSQLDEFPDYLGYDGIFWGSGFPPPLPTKITNSSPGWLPASDHQFRDSPIHGY